MTRHLTPFSFSVCLLLTTLLSLQLPRLSQAQVCTPPPALPPVVKVAILVFCNASVGILPDNPNFLTSGCTPELNPSVRGFHYGVDMYVKAMEAQQPMPLRDASTVSWEYTYINLGYINWAAPAWTAMYAQVGNETHGLAWDILMTNQYNGPYTFVHMPILVRDPITITIGNICEDNSACIVLHGFMSAANMAQCMIDTTTGLLPPDCSRRGHVVGMRRFQNVYGVLFDSTTVAYSALDTYHTLGVKTIAIVAEAPLFSVFAGYAAQRTQEFAKQLNIKVLSTTVFVACTTGVNCPTKKVDGTPAIGQVQILPNGWTASDFGAQMKALNPDAVVMIGSSSGQAFWTFASLIDGFKANDWAPKMINWAGGVDASLRPYLSDYNDLLYTWTTAPWDSRLTGPQYQNVKTAANFELFPAETDLDAPQIFAREFNKTYGKYFPGGSFNFLNAGSVIPVLGFQALTFAQKIVEMALSASIPALTSAALKVSAPSVYHQLQFDLTGRTTRVNEMLLQFVPAATPSPTTAHSLKLIAPYNIGEQATFPIPTWSERTFVSQTYEQSNERMMAGLTTVCIVVVIAVGFLILVKSNHQVIRAATPSFCLLTLVGAIFMLLSNYFYTTSATDADCGAQVWLLTLGFTLLFSSLFIKTFRIWKIFFSSLAAVKMKDSELLLAVAAFLFIDIIINGIWSGMGMKSMMVVVDPLRPSMNYTTCDYSNTLPFVYAHLAIKCGLLLFGICLTWLVRNTPSQFNESSFIGICIYNVSIVICFVIPILAKQLGGRDTTYLIRAFAIMFVTLTSTLVLFIPKLLSIYSVRTVSGRLSLLGGDTDASKSGDFSNTSQKTGIALKSYSLPTGIKDISGTPSAGGAGRADAGTPTPGPVATAAVLPKGSLIQPARLKPSAIQLAKQLASNSSLDGAEGEASAPLTAVRVDQMAASEAAVPPATMGNNATAHHVPPAASSTEQHYLVPGAVGEVEGEVNSQPILMPPTD